MVKKQRISVSKRPGKDNTHTKNLHGGFLSLSSVRATWYGTCLEGSPSRGSGGA